MYFCFKRAQAAQTPFLSPISSCSRALASPELCAGSLALFSTWLASFASLLELG